MGNILPKHVATYFIEIGQDRNVREYELCYVFFISISHIGALF